MITALAIFNQLLQPVATTGAANNFFTSTEEQYDHIRILRKDEYLENFRIKDNSLTARDYLNLSSGVVWKNKRSEHVCRHLAGATFDFYMELVRQNSREDLEDSVRIAVTTLGKSGHAWIEVKENGEWIPYETTKYTPILALDEIRDYSQRTMNSRSDNGAREPENLSYAGTKDFYPTLSSFLYPGGFLRTLYKVKTKKRR